MSVKGWRTLVLATLEGTRGNKNQGGHSAIKAVRTTMRKSNSHATTMPWWHACSPLFHVAPFSVWWCQLWHMLFPHEIMCSKCHTQFERRPGNHSPTHRTNSMITPVCHAIVFKAVWRAKPAQAHSGSLPDGCCGKAMPSTCLSGVREGA